MSFAPKNQDFTWPRVGVGVVVLTPAGIVLMRRAPGKHGAGTWSLPGGALELGESLVDCAARETMEEIGVRLSGAELLPAVTEDLFPEHGQHWVTHYVLARTEDSPVNREPHKCDGLGAFWPGALPGPLFVGLSVLAERGLLPVRWTP
jgi:8-oxo-dGTP diphosphatase